MAKSFNILLFLMILTFKDVNGRPSREKIKDGKFVYGQPLASVSKKWYLI